MAATPVQLGPVLLVAWPVQLGALVLAVGPVVQLDMFLSSGGSAAQLGSLLLVWASVQLGPLNHPSHLLLLAALGTGSGDPSHLYVQLGLVLLVVWLVQLGALFLAVGPVVQLDMFLSLGGSAAQLGTLLLV